MVSASAFFTFGFFVVVYWWKVTRVCEWSKRIMSVIVGLSLFSENMVLLLCTRQRLILKRPGRPTRRKSTQWAVGAWRGLAFTAHATADATKEDSRARLGYS